jgi:hypothetical protein
MQDVEDRHREPLSPMALLRRLRDWTRQELSVPGEADLEIDDLPLVDDPAARPRRPPEMRIEVRRGIDDAEPAPLPDLSSLPVEATVRSTPRPGEAPRAAAPERTGTDGPAPASAPANGAVRVAAAPSRRADPTGGATANGGAAGSNGRPHPAGQDALADRVARLEAGMRLLAETLELAHADVAEAVRGLQAAVRAIGSAQALPEQPDRGHDLTGLARQEDLAGMARQEDLAELVRRDDLAELARHEDLGGLVRQEDLAGFATRDDVARAIAEAVEPLSAALAGLTEATAAVPAAVEAAVDRLCDRLGDRIDTVRVDVEESLLALLPRRENGGARHPDIWAAGR